MSISKLSARMGARRLLYSVLIEKRMLTEAANSLPIDGPEAARAQRLASLTLRYLGKIDTYLRPHLQRAPALRIQMILRLAVAELKLDRAADYGVVDEAVAAARAVPKTARQAGLVNAVLRKLATDRDAWAAVPQPTLPPWLRKLVARDHGQSRLEQVEAAHLKAVPLDLTLRDDAAAPEGLEGVLLPTGSMRVAGAQVTALPGFEAGAFWVQDAAATIPVKTLGDVSGLNILDIGAAPGGKTLQMAAAGAHVTALDVSEGRVLRLRKNLNRTKLMADIVVADALDWEPDGPFDAILLDAPCSATGTIRRHPDLPHLRKPQDIEALTLLQYQLLDRALGWLGPNGRLVYCTCSLLKTEGEHQVSAALKRHPGVQALVLNPDDFGLPAETACDQGLRMMPDLWPDLGGMDGFFVGVLQTPS